MNRDVRLDIEIHVSPPLPNVYRDPLTGWYYIADRKGHVLPRGGTLAYETRTAAWRALREQEEEENKP